MRTVNCIVWLIALLLAACGANNPTCPTETYPLEYLEAAPSERAPVQASDAPAVGTSVSIGGKATQVDRVVAGALCHDALSGTVYVSCDVQVVRWVENPLFLQDCDFSVAPGSVVYVASHNDAPYYNGCSCHTGEDP
jgi:hypothetical protein